MALNPRTDCFAKSHGDFEQIYAESGLETDRNGQSWTDGIVPPLPYWVNVLSVCLKFGSVLIVEMVLRAMTFPSRLRYGGGLQAVAVPLRLAHYPPVITCFRGFFGAYGSERATAVGEARRHAPAAWRARRSSAACGSAPGSGMQRGGGRRCWEEAGEPRCSRPCLPLPRAPLAAAAADLTRAPLLARALPGRAAPVLGQAAIADGIITEGRSLGSRLRKPAAQPQ